MQAIGSTSSGTLVSLALSVNVATVQRGENIEARDNTGQIYGLGEDIMSSSQHQAQVGVLAGIQCLRAIAALMVVWEHARDQFVWIGTLLPSEIGNKGVDVFFVISGFIMVLATDRQTLSPWVFLKKRLIRIVPLYWLITLALLAVALVAPHAVRSTVVAWPHVIASLIFWPMAYPGQPDQIFPLLIPGWSLNFEMAFYALFGLTLFMPRKLRTPTILAVLATTVALGALTNLSGAAAFYSDNIVLTFGLGLVIGELYYSDRCQLSNFLAWLAVLSGICFLVITDAADLHFRILEAGLPAALIVWGGSNLRYAWHQWPSWLIKLGDASYALYLTHMLTLGVLRMLLSSHLKAPSAPLVGLGFMVLALVVSSVVGWLVHKWVEKPLTRLFNQRLLA